MEDATLPEIERRSGCKAQPRLREERARSPIALANHGKSATRHMRKVICCLVVAMAAVPASAQDYSDLPSVTQVREQNQGSDPEDTAARQTAAFSILMDFVEVTTGLSGFDIEQMPPVARGMWRLYANNRGGPRQIISSFLDVTGYRHSDEFRREVIGRLSESNQAAYWSAKASEADGTREASNRRDVSVDEVRAAWEGEGPESRPWLYGLLVLTFVGFVGFLRDFFFHFGIFGNRLRAGWRSYQLSGSTGTVQTYGPQSATLQDFVLKSSADGEENFSIPIDALALRRDHRVSCIALLKRGASDGPLLACKNHSLGSTYLDTPTIKRIMKARIWFVLFFVGLFALFALSSALIEQRLWAVIGMFGVPIALVVGLIVRAIVNRRRMKRTLSQLTEMLDELGKSNPEDEYSRNPFS